LVTDNVTERSPGEHLADIEARTTLGRGRLAANSVTCAHLGHI
jgi:hypothetical protein